MDRLLAAKQNLMPCRNGHGRRKHSGSGAFSNGGDHPELEVRCPEIFDRIQQPVQYRDNSPTQEAEPHDHRRYYQCGKEPDRDFPAHPR